MEAARLLALLVTAAIAVSGAEQLNSACTVGDVPGTCVPIRDCRALYSLLQGQEKLTSTQIDYLRQFHCGFQSNHPLVCCVRGEVAPLPQDVTGHPNLGLINQGCGRAADIGIRIINGEKTRIYEFPWMARLRVRSWRGDRFTCGGTLISEKYVLTAAHCIPTSNQSSLDSVSLGYHNLSPEERCEGEGDDRVCIPPPQNIKVENVTIHPLYSKNGAFSHDIAVVRLITPANLETSTVKTICLPVELSKQTQDLDGLWLTVAGWGQTLNETESPSLLQVSVPVVGGERCRQQWGMFGGTVSGSQLCAGDSTVIKGSCRGDSGGPFMTAGRVNHDLRMIQYGIISFGPGSCTNTKVPVVYTRVGHYIRWILNTIRP